MTRRVMLSAVFVVVAASLSVAAVQDLTPKDAASMEKKLADILGRGARKRAANAARVRTPVSEREINAFLKFSYRDQLPEGVVSPEVSLAGNRRVSGQAMVDLDAVRKSKERGWLDPAAYLTGTVQVRAMGLFQAANGKATFQFESAHVGALPVPKALFQELVSHYSRSPEVPDGIDIDKPFDMPASIREVEIQRGAATIVQ
jgi:hypothetical protein